ncbi:unnamed protein product [Effrenium voratum]|nr:unnamed protein product [Effrenium voratum]
MLERTAEKWWDGVQSCNACGAIQDDYDESCEECEVSAHLARVVERSESATVSTSKGRRQNWDLGGNKKRRQRKKAEKDSMELAESRCRRPSPALRPRIQVFHAAVAAVLVRSSAECSGAACAAVDAAGEEQHSLLQRGAEGTRSATSLPEAHRANSSTLQRSVQLSGANHSKAQSFCLKITGGSCAITQICDDSRSASCDTQQGSLTWGQCVCPEFTCASNGLPARGPRVKFATLLAAAPPMLLKR